jgi:hypothetical protein
MITADRFAIQLLADYVPATKDKLSSHLLVRAPVEADLDALKSYDENAIAFEDKMAEGHVHEVHMCEWVRNLSWPPEATGSGQAHAHATGRIVRSALPQARQ